MYLFYPTQCAYAHDIHVYRIGLLCVNDLLNANPRKQKFNEMNWAHLASPIRGELGYAHWPQLGTQFIALLGTKLGAH